VYVAKQEVTQDSQSKTALVRTRHVSLTW
jgi:hypothetical protein